MISYRQLHVLDETYVMNGCKEDCCYVAKDFDVEMVKAKNNLVARDYVLPDFTAIRRQVLNFGFCLTCDKSSKTISTQGFHEDCRGVKWEAWRGGTIGIIQCFSSIIKTYPNDIYIEILFSSKAQKYASDVQVRMNNERFMVPEILFRPSDIGIQQVKTGIICGLLYY